MIKPYEAIGDDCSGKVNITKQSTEIAPAEDVLRNKYLDIILFYYSDKVKEGNPVGN